MKDGRDEPGHEVAPWVRLRAAPYELRRSAVHEPEHEAPRQ